MSIVDPTFRDAFDVPDLLRQAAGGDDTRPRRLPRTTRRWQAASAQALSQGLHASALCADWRFPWDDSSAPLAGREAKLQAGLRTPTCGPSTARPPSASGLRRSAFPGRRPPPRRPPPPPSRLCRPCFSPAATTSPRRSSGRAVRLRSHPAAGSSWWRGPATTCRSAPPAIAAGRRSRPSSIRVGAWRAVCHACRSGEPPTASAGA